ncbi:MAG: SPOR domain-containing protein [Nitrospirae bacterium]|nr:SPOR domain-containing protein [Nitrospirota bacterium]
MLITIIIVFSSVSFVLGFFTGKKLSVNGTGVGSTAVSEETGNKPREAYDSNDIKVEENKAPVSAIYTDGETDSRKVSESAVSPGAAGSNSNAVSPGTTTGNSTAVSGSTENNGIGNNGTGNKTGARPAPTDTKEKADTQKLPASFPSAREDGGQNAAGRSVTAQNTSGQNAGEPTGTTKTAIQPSATGGGTGAESKPDNKHGQTVHQKHATEAKKTEDHKRHETATPEKTNEKANEKTNGKTNGKISMEQARPVLRNNTDSGNAGNGKNMGDGKNTGNKNDNKTQAAKVAATAKALQPARSAPAEQKQTIITPRKSSVGKFFIQVGAFKSLGEAMRLQEELSQKGFESNVSKHAISDSVTLYKVRLGNYSRDEATQTLSKLNKKGVKGFMRED